MPTPSKATTESAAGPREGVRAALARSAVYALLARTLDDSTEDVPAAAQAPRALVEALADAVPQRTREALAAVLAALAAGTRDDQNRPVFTHVRSPDCPQYEAPYRAGHIFQETQELADINGFYRAFGLQAGSLRRERPDHIATELEFLQVVALREAEALAAGEAANAAVSETAYRHFLRDHALHWMPSFAARLAVFSPVALHRAAAALLTGHLEAEAERLQLDLPSTVDHSPGAPPPLEEESCPLFGPAAGEMMEQESLR